MLLNPATGDITFVDFELSGYHYSYFDLAFFFSVQLAFGKQGFIAPDEPAFTDEHRTIFLREYLHAKYEAKGWDIKDIQDEEFELLDYQHRILETLVNLQGISRYMWLGCALKDNSIFDLVLVSKEAFLVKKRELPLLHDKCKNLIKNLAKENTKWWWHAENCSNLWTLYIDGLMQ